MDPKIGQNELFEDLLSGSPSTLIATSIQIDGNIYSSIVFFIPFHNPKCIYFPGTTVFISYCKDVLSNVLASQHNVSKH